MKELTFRRPASMIVEHLPKIEDHEPNDTSVNLALTTFGPDGNVLTLADLPSPNTKRWVARRKAEVVVAVKGGLLSLSDACERYKLTVEEFLSWQHAIRRHGMDGLHATQAQQYRNAIMPRLRVSKAQQFKDATIGEPVSGD